MNETDLSREGSGRDIPGDLLVPLHLRITNRPRLRTIGDGLVVPGHFRLGGPHPKLSLTPEQRRLPIRALPRGLRVGKSLEVRSCFLLERLPEDMAVGGSIVLADCDALVALPDPWHVGWSLTITGGRSLAALPADLRVAGDFQISGTRITALPPGLVVGGSLVIQGRCRIASIPASIRVADDIVLRRCPIESLPQGLRVAKTLRVQGAHKLTRLPSNLEVPGTLDLCDCDALVELPPGLRIGQSLKLRGCRSLQTLPAGLTVPYGLDLRGCTALTSLPAGMRIGLELPKQRNAGPRDRRAGRVFRPALRLADCTGLTELPDDLQLGGPIEVAGSGLRDLPLSLRNARILWRGVLVPPDVVFHPERVAPIDVLRERNAELRRVMMERLGPEFVLDSLRAETRDEDRDAGGPRRLVFVRQLNHCYLLCHCPSTARQYLLRVPPEMAACRQAAAWVAGFDDPDRFKPLVET